MQRTLNKDENMLQVANLEEDEDVDDPHMGEVGEATSADLIAMEATCSSISSEPMHLDKEVQVQPQIKMFISVGTQTEKRPNKLSNTKIHPVDINELCHLEDHNYSLGPCQNPSLDKNREMMESCHCAESSIQVFDEQMPLAVHDDVQNEIVVESTNHSSSHDPDPNHSSSPDPDLGCPSDDDSDDPSYCPPVSDDSETDEHLVSTTHAEEKKFIVFESQLSKLFTRCQNCSGILDRTTQTIVGSMVRITTDCINGHQVSWESQPQIGRTAAGNLLIPAAVLFSGNTYQHIADFAKHLNLEFVSSAHYYSVQKTTLFPVEQHTWVNVQKAVVKQLKQSRSVDLCGDGRCDSPGHSAKYGTYTLMDEKTKLIVDFNIVQVTEVTSSNAMEYEGCKRTLNATIKKKVPIRCLTTDRHTTITAKMRTNYAKIVHQYDVWHLSKWVTKKLTKKAKKKSCQELLQWIQSVSNHFWWCSATCEGNADTLKEKWLSLLFHITGKHRWKASKEFKKINQCAHPRLATKQQKSTLWLENGSPAHVALEEVMTNKKFLNDLARLTEFHHTGELESYHSLMTKYVPKCQHFCYNGMVARTQLAVLDHNANVDRTQAKASKGPNEGEQRYKIACGKQRKNWVAKEIKTPKIYSHIEGMMNDVIRSQEGKKFKYKPKKQAKNIAPLPRPPKQDVIDKLHTYR